MDKKKLAELKKFVEKYTEGTGLFPEVMMAQILLESGNLESGLTTLHNNLSGQKIAHKDKAGKTVGVDYVLMATNEGFKTEALAKAYQKKKLGQKYVVNSLKQNPKTKEWIVNYDGPFKKFETFEKGVEAHIDFLTGKNSKIQKARYAKVREAKTPEAQIKALKASGYATHGAYIEDITTKLDTIVYKEYPDFEGLTKLDKEIRVAINKDVSEIYDPQIQRLRDKGFNEEADELEKEGEARIKQLKEQLKGKTEKEVTKSLENEKKRFLNSDDQNRASSVGRNTGVEKTELQKAGIDLSPQDGYNDVLNTQSKVENQQDVVDSITKLEEIVANENEQYTFSQIRTARESLEELQDFNENNKKKLGLIDDPNVDTSTIVFKETIDSRAEIQGKVDKVLNDIYTVKEAEAKEVARVELEGEEEEPYDSTEGGKYVDVPNIPGAEYKEETTTDGLLSEGQGSEVSLDPSKGLSILEQEEEMFEVPPGDTPEEIAAAEAARKAARKEKIAKLGDVLTQAGKTAGVALMAGAGIKSMFEATKLSKTNKIRVSPLMQEAFQKAKALSTQGMTYEERTAAMSDMNNAYAGAMKNVMAISGGQRSTALANMGVVDASRVNALVDLAGKDAALRQGNMKIYQQQATSLGNMTLTADSTNEQLKAKLEEGRKNRLTKIGESLYTESLELARNFADQRNNKDLVSTFAELQSQINSSNEELDFVKNQLGSLYVKE